MFKKRKSDYNWVGRYIKDYNEMIYFYENKLKEKDKEIVRLKNEVKTLKQESKFNIKKKQISDSDIVKIRKLQNQGKSYSFISKETGWSKSTISRVINNKNGIYNN